MKSFDSCCGRAFISHQLAGVTAESATEAMMASYHMNPSLLETALRLAVRVCGYCESWASTEQALSRQVVRLVGMECLQAFSQHVTWKDGWVHVQLVGEKCRCSIVDVVIVSAEGEVELCMKSVQLM
jgi:hypothetical protein